MLGMFCYLIMNLSLMHCKNYYSRYVRSCKIFFHIQDTNKISKFVEIRCFPQNLPISKYWYWLATKTNLGNKFCFRTFNCIRCILYWSYLLVLSKFAIYCGFQCCYRNMLSSYLKPHIFGLPQKVATNFCTI